MDKQNVCVGQLMMDTDCSRRLLGCVSVCVCVCLCVCVCVCVCVCLCLCLCMCLCVLLNLQTLLC